MPVNVVAVKPVKDTISPSTTKEPEAGQPAVEPTVTVPPLAGRMALLIAAPNVVRWLIKVLYRSWFAGYPVYGDTGRLAP